MKSLLLFDLEYTFIFVSVIVGDEFIGLVSDFIMINTKCTSKILFSTKFSDTVFLRRHVQLDQEFERYYFEKTTRKSCADHVFV